MYMSSCLECALVAYAHGNNNNIICVRVAHGSNNGINLSECIEPSVSQCIRMTHVTCGTEVVIIPLI